MAKSGRRSKDAVSSLDLDQAIEGLRRAAEALSTEAARQSISALGEAANAFQTIQDAVKAVAVQDAVKAVAVQDAVKAVAVQDAVKAVAVQDAVKAVAHSLVGDEGNFLRAIVAEEVAKALGVAQSSAVAAKSTRRGAKPTR